jgi:GxxExxY protein
MLVDGLVLIENKAVQAVLPVHHAQLLTYLRLSGRRLGFLINWNVPLLKDGITRLVNSLQSDLAFLCVFASLRFIR